MYLTDSDLKNMLEKCSNNMTEKGVIFIKENVFDPEEDIGQYIVDKSDNSVIRTVE